MYNVCIHQHVSNKFMIVLYLWSSVEDIHTLCMKSMIHDTISDGYNYKLNFFNKCVKIWCLLEDGYNSIESETRCKTKTES